FQSYPSWESTAKKVEVVERLPDSRPAVVSIDFDFLVKKVKVVNKYSYNDEDYVLKWQTVDGDIDSQKGIYVFEKVNDNLTCANLTISLKAGFSIADKFLDYMRRIVMNRAMNSFRRAVESSKKH
ncbi:hypothetical protein KY308_00560, partial [Candidatus Woesearchaeota archaeon]|nr:hypothetical protein [Candidatus Woesearchaeota archaeon]